MSSGQHRQHEGEIRRLRRDVGETAEELAHRLDAPTRARAGAQQAMDNARTTAASISPSRWAAGAAVAFAIAAAAVARREHGHHEQGR